MNILLRDGSLVLNVEPIQKREDITDGCKLYYELGRKRFIEGGYGDNWIRSGKFKEITNPQEFKKEDDMLDDINYIKHHNFVVLKPRKKNKQ